VEYAAPDGAFERPGAAATKIPPRTGLMPAKNGLVAGAGGVTVLAAMKLKTIILILAAPVLLAGCGKQETLNDHALAMALNIVSNSLVAPTTAKFSVATCQERKDHTFLISGKVDSQNSYGAMLRKDFFCVITNAGAGNLIWLGTSVGGDAQVNQDFK
jgi:uncharacterized lipoprotein YajG